MRKLVALMAVAVMGLAVATLTAAEGEEAEKAVDVIAYATEGGYKFIGAAGCKMCHKSEKSGAQYPKWLEGPHSKAYEVLASDEAKAAAVAAGIEGNPQEADACLKCHVTGHGAPAEMFGKKYAVTDGVGCESCHGAGSGYKGKKVMKDHAASLAAGLIMPTEAQCRSCHNEESPTFEEFNFEEAVKTIAHPTPAAE